MQFRKLGNSDLKVSLVGLGTWVMGGDFWGDIDEQECIAAIHAALDAGVNLIDTAPAYGSGRSEEIIGKALLGRRDKVILATKCGNRRNEEGRYVRDSRPHMLREELENSLRLLQTDYIDLYQVHWPDPNTPFAETFGELAKMKSEGKIREIGVSNFTCQQMDEANKLVNLVSLQPPYSLLERGIEDEILPYCHKNHVGVLSYGSIGAGALTGKFKDKPAFAQGDNRARFYPFFSEENWPKTAAVVDVLSEIAAERGRPTVHVAINWVLRQPGVTVALVGARRPDQARINAEAGEWALSPEEDNRIKEAYDRIFKA